MIIREAIDWDLEAILRLEEESFGEEEGPDIVELIKLMLNDPTAQPLLSLVAEDGGQIVGHIVFTGVTIGEYADRIKASILAPLAVAKGRQRQGIGGMLINDGLGRLKESGIALVFVLGYPDYYTRYGFEPATPHGFIAQHPIPSQHADAWMVQELVPGSMASISGQVQCSDILSLPEYW